MIISRKQYSIADFFLPILSTIGPIKGEVIAPATNPRE